MKADVSLKQEHIVEAAIRRFSHFGINKTTLAEIADDVRASKTSLYYYFPDKNSLLEAVAQRIIDEFLVEFEAALTSAHSVDEGLLKLVVVKREFFKKYQLLALQADSIEMTRCSSHFAELIKEAHSKTAVLIAGLLNRGVQQRVLRPIDITKTSDLLLETLEAFEYGIKYKTGLVGVSDIDALFAKQKEVIELLLNGLKNPEGQH